MGDTLRRVSTPPASVAAGHPDTARIGLEILQAGGSAADAVAGMVLGGCVAETIFTGLSGGGFATVYDAATREVHCLDFFVAVPGLDGTVAGPPTAIEVAFGGVPMPFSLGGPTVAVPGTPTGVAELHRRFGKLPWSEIVTPARDLAARGSTFTEQHASLLPDIAAAMLVSDGVAAYSRTEPGAERRMLAAGELLHHPGLADVLEAYRVEGPAAMMAGDFAATLVDQVRSDGGSLSLEDLAAYRVRDLKPGSARLGQGTVRVRTNDLDNFAGTIAALEVEQLRAGGPVRAAALVKALRAPAARSETTSVAAVDAAGNACSSTHSLGLGSGIWTSGVHGNSMMGEGELLREDLPPGSRMGSMMVPSVVTGPDGELLVVGGAAGGSRIRPAMVQVLTRILIEGMSAEDAVRAPRLAATPDTVHVEPGFEPEVAAGLTAAGESVVQWESIRPYFGGAAVINAAGPGADPRRGGSALRA